MIIYVNKDGYVKWRVKRSDYAEMLMSFINSRWSKNSFSFWVYKCIKSSDR